MKNKIVFPALLLSSSVLLVACGSGGSSSSGSSAARIFETWRRLSHKNATQRSVCAPCSSTTLPRTVPPAPNASWSSVHNVLASPLTFLIQVTVWCLRFSTSMGHSPFFVPRTRQAGASAIDAQRSSRVGAASSGTQSGQKRRSGGDSQQ